MHKNFYHLKYIAAWFVFANDDFLSSWMVVYIKHCKLQIQKCQCFGWPKISHLQGLLSEIERTNIFHRKRSFEVHTLFVKIGRKCLIDIFHSCWGWNLHDETFPEAHISFLLSGPSGLKLYWPKYRGTAVGLCRSRE